MDDIDRLIDAISCIVDDICEIANTINEFMNKLSEQILLKQYGCDSDNSTNHNFVNYISYRIPIIAYILKTRPP